MDRNDVLFGILVLTFLDTFLGGATVYAMINGGTTSRVTIGVMTAVFVAFTYYLAYYQWRLSRPQSNQPNS